MSGALHPRGHVLALSGGVGGAKLAAGLAAVLPAGRLTIAVNTGDDFEHLGLTVCPDIDSVVYALAGLNDTERGWGVADERWRAMDMLGKLGEAQWFNLGDRDLGMHIARSWRLRDGQSLVHATVYAARRRVVPIVMTTSTTIAGLFSLAIGLGGKSLLWGPVASSIVWGLGFSTLLTLFVIPLLYLVFMGNSRLVRGERWATAD